MKGVLIYQPKSCYGTDFSNAAWASALNLDIAEPLLEDGTPMTSFMGRMWMERYLQGKGPHLVGSYYRGGILPRGFSDSVRLCSSPEGETRRLQEYDYVVVSLFWFHASYVAFLKGLLHSKPLVGIEEYGFDDMLLFDEAALAEFHAAARCLDLMVCYTTPSYEYISQLCANTHILPFPMPPEYCRVMQREDKPITSACIGVSHFVSDQSNLLTSCIAARQLPEVRESSCAVELIGVHNYRMHSTEPLQQLLPELTITGWIATDFVEAIARFGVLIQPTTRRSFGRLSADCALAGVPCISTRGCYMQDYCWPGLAVEPYDTSAIVSRWRRLMDDQPFRVETTEYAQTKVSEYATLWQTKASRLAYLVESISRLKTP